MRARSFLPLIFALLVGPASLAACTADTEDGTTGDDANFTEGSNEAKAILALVNMTSVNADELVREARITTSAAKNIIAHRDGADAQPGTDDDDVFDNLAELDAVRDVGPSTLAKLYDYAKRKGLVPGSGGGEGGQKVDVIFSPQATESSHLARIAREIDSAQSSIDIAIYSYSDANLTARIQAAVQRGVKVRFIYEAGSADSRAANPAQTTSARVENAGADVRYVNKVMHHKLVIIDGPRDDLSKAGATKLVAGSANFANSAATRFDENTLFISSAPALALKFQREFDLMWTHSKDFVAKPYTQDLSTALIPDSAIPASPDFDVFFSSHNFSISSNGTTFTSSSANHVADALVDAIRNAQTSIHLASAHLRSRPVAEALLAKHQASPDVDIRVYLDNQEYVSKTAHNAQVDALNACLTRATSDSQRSQCTDKGFLFGYQLDQGGIDVRYKFYAYRWDHSYAPQMHHKYMIVDGKTLFSGSYNLSDNAEHGTFENMMVFRGAENAALVSSFEGNFEKMWATGRTDNRLDALLQRVENDITIPIVFDAMALSHGEITNLKFKIRTNCAAVDSPEFRQNASGRTTCTRANN
jgi:phosphatidylserine/phosphatidylglycerophosphate/cardiolipin synthase-like enzyme